MSFNVKTLKVTDLWRGMIVGDSKNDPPKEVASFIAEVLSQLLLFLLFYSIRYVYFSNINLLILLKFSRAKWISYYFIFCLFVSLLICILKFRF